MVFGAFKKENQPPSAIDALIRMTHGNSPPPKSANLIVAIKIAHTKLLFGIVDLKEVTQIATSLFNGPMPYSTHDLAVATTMNLFRSADSERQKDLQEVQIDARLEVLGWVKDRKVAPIIAKSFEDTLYNMFKDPTAPPASSTQVAKPGGAVLDRGRGNTAKMDGAAGGSISTGRSMSIQRDDPVAPADAIWAAAQRSIQEDRRVNGPMWSVAVRLSLLAVFVLPALSLWATTPHQREALILRTSDVGAPFILALIAALLVGYVSWNKAAFKAVLLGGTGALYALAVLGALNSDAGEHYRKWSVTDWFYLFLWIAPWVLTFWCTWVILRNLVYPALLRLRR